MTMGEATKTISVVQSIVAVDQARQLQRIGLAQYLTDRFWPNEGGRERQLLAESCLLKTATSPIMARSNK